MGFNVNGLYGNAVRDQSGNTVIDFGPTVPSDGAKGYSVGAMFIQTDAASEAVSWYCNVGTVASANFDAIDLNIVEAGYISGVTPGTATASKVVVLGASKEISTITTATITNLNLTALTQTAAAAEHGAGAIGTGVAPATYRRTENGVIITEIKVDLEGLASVATANDAIGLAAGGNAYIGRNVVATNGVIFKIELICVETPAGGDDDVNVVANSSGTIAYDGAAGTAYGVDGGDAVAGQVVQDLVQGLTANHYFYLTAGTGDTAATYTAGQFIVRLHGHPVLT